METISSLLDRKKEDIKKPSNLPAGHYRFRISRPYNSSLSANGQWETLSIFCNPIAAQEDVDEDELRELTRPIEKVMVVHSFIFGVEGNEQADNDSTVWRLQEFINKLGVIEDDQMTLNEQLDKIVNAEFIGELLVKPRKDDPEQLDMSIGRTFSLADSENAV